jgi:hypothetical protein
LNIGHDRRERAALMEDALMLAGTSLRLRQASPWAPTHAAIMALIRRNLYGE